MQLHEARVALRPRATFEALDLGILLAQRHRRLLMSAWACTCLPVWLLLTTVLWSEPLVVMLLIWWLKPIFERLMLHILAQAVFDEPPGLVQALRQWPRLLKPQLLQSLTLRRLSLSRSFTLPVQQLEGLERFARQKRLASLQSGHLGAARWLTLVGMHVEALLCMGAMTALYLMVPEQVEQNWSWEKLMRIAGGDWLWFEHLNNLIYVLVLVLWGPIYVSCGFCLYLNRRTVLEAWDLERVFRRLRQRVTAVAPGALAFLLWLAIPLPAPADEAAGPQAPRLTHQPLDSQTSSNSAQQIVHQPPFRNTEEVTRLRWKEGETPHVSSPDLPQQLPTGNWLNLLARSLEIVLWSALIIALVGLCWHYRHRLRGLIRKHPARRRLLPDRPRQLFGLDVQPDSLPDDIAREVEALWPQQPRQALGLLYRALLSRLLDQHRLPLKASDTEGQVLLRVAVLGQQPLYEFTALLTGHWQALAYGHRAPPAGLFPTLCEQWRELFEGAPKR